MGVARPEGGLEVCETRMPLPREGNMSAGPSAWDEPGRTLRGMLLTEPGSRVEGDTEAVLHVLFETSWYLLREHMAEDQADRLALTLLGRYHESLTQCGYVVRQYPGDD